MTNNDLKLPFLALTDGSTIPDYDLHQICTEAESLGSLYAQLADCREPMPSDTCKALGLPVGSTYADGVKFQRELDGKLSEEQKDIDGPLLDEDELAMLHSVHSC